MPFDETKAQRAVEFFEKLLTHTKGRWAGVRFELLPWELDLIRTMYGTVREDGRRQYRIVYCEVPKKNGKSEVGAGVALKQLVADDEMGAEVYSAAGDREQASLVYNVAAQMVRNKPTLDKRLKVIDSRRRIVDHKHGGFYQVLSAESYTKHGISPSGIIFDELHAQPNRQLWDVLIEGTDAARDQQLVFVITTAGVFDPESIAWEVHDYACKVRDGVIVDPSFLPVIFESVAPENKDEKDNWDDPVEWRKANPSMGYIFDEENISAHCQQAKNNPARLNNFLRFRLNRWVSQISRWMPMDEWNACAGDVVEKSLLRQPCYGALDLSSSLDMSSLALVFPPTDDEEIYRILMRYYMPAENIQERAKRDQVPYDMWIKAGLITATPGNVIDYKYIRKDVRKAAAKFGLQEIAYDPWGAVQLANQLQDDDGIVMVEHRQGYKSMSNPMKELMKLVKSKKLAHGGNPVLRWNADNIVVKTDPAENIKPEKAKSIGRIDGLVAVIMALGRALDNGGEKPLGYNDREDEQLLRVI